MGHRVIQPAWAALLAIWLLAGCGPSAEQIAAQKAVGSYYIGNYQAAARTLRPLAQRPNEDFVLNNLRLGSAALANYDLDEAEWAFLRAYEVMNSFGVNTGGRTLGAVLVSESVRVWRGEPFERAMAHFYLGLVYYIRQDWQNARAAFENALFKLRDYSDGNGGPDQYRQQESDFAVALVMLGKCWQKIGREDLARANYQRAIELRPQLTALADYQRNAQSNVLLVIDYGYGPRKLTTFDGSILGFGPKPSEVGPVPQPRVWVDHRALDAADVARPPVDLLALAQERRWQSLDTIRAVKSALGTGLMAAGAYQGLKRKPEYGSAAALLAAGLLLKATSQADLRQWEMLPRSVLLVPLRLNPGKHDLTVSFAGHEGYTQTWRGLIAPQDQEATYYLRVARFTGGTFDWPPPSLAQPEAIVCLPR